MRLKNFITFLITGILACAGTFAIHYENVKFASDLAKNGLAGFGLIVLFPLYIVLYILTYGLAATSLINAIKSIKSENKFIKIISIILLIFILILVAFLVYTTSQTINLIWR